MNRFALAITSIGLLGAAFAPNMAADEWNKKTILTVNEPIQVPNKVLPPGKYVMKLLSSPSDRHIVQIFGRCFVRSSTRRHSDKFEAVPAV